MIVLNTRPKSLSRKIRGICEEKKIELHNAYLSKVEPLDFDENIDTWKLKLNGIEKYSNLVFTSQSAAIFGLKILEHKFDIKNISQNILCIGSATKEILANRDIDSISPSVQSSEGLMGLIENKYSGKSLLFCGKNSNKNLQKKLNSAIDEIVCYELIFDKTALNEIIDGPKIILIYNFLTLSFILENIDQNLLNQKDFVVASNRIKEKALEINRDLKIVVSEDPSDEEMLVAAKNFI